MGKIDTISKLITLKQAVQLSHYFDFIPEYKDVMHQYDEFENKYSIEEIKDICDKYLGYSYDKLIREILKTIGEL